MQIFVKSESANDPRIIAKAIAENIEVAAQIMDQGDTFTTVLTFHTEQTGETADARVMREHLARQLTQVAAFLVLYGTPNAPGEST